MSSPSAHAHFACETLFHIQSRQTLELVSSDAFEQWRLWEQTANFTSFVQPTESFKLPFTKVLKEDVRIVADPDLPREIAQFFSNSDASVRWIQHPYNTSASVPFTDKTSDGTIPAYMTASRSLAPDGPLRGFTIKAGTDHPHGPRGETQPEKASTKQDIISAMVRSRHLKEVDKQIGFDPELLLLPEVMTVAEKKSGNGFILRDVRALDSGYYYLPALSIPYVGREIARHNGESFELFWKKNYGESLGRAKALLLLRYGLQLETPNAQNILIELDRNLRPTGRIVFRDISDSFFVTAVALGLGFSEKVKEDRSLGYTPSLRVRPYWELSIWKFNQAGDHSIRSHTLNEWGLAHNQTYRNTLAQELQTSTMPDWSNTSADSVPLYFYLESSKGQSELRSYRENRMKNTAGEQGRE